MNMNYESIDKNDVRSFVAAKYLRELLKGEGLQIGEGSIQLFSKYTRIIVKHYAKFVQDELEADPKSRGPRIQPRHVKQAFATFAESILDDIYGDRNESS